MTHNTVYCDMCGFPVIYCQFRSQAKQKEFGCYAWLLKENPELHKLVYGEQKVDETAQQTVVEAVQQPTEQVQPEVQQDNKDEDGEEDSEGSEQETQPTISNNNLKIDPKLVPPFGLTIKPHLKKKADYIPICQVRLASRGGKKWVTQIWNYVDFPSLNPKDVCSGLAKQFAGAAGITTMPDGSEEIIALQGSFVIECVQYLEKLGIPRDQIFVAQQQKHKGKKKDAKKDKAKAEKEKVKREGK
ncbi:Translation_initiation factor SUI1 family protein [Hexamita inflata]|uniref:Translation_initiation factor SUI1 family protein n=1 Tax=Hexamita inflata TaxID=28002 RepID=A0ABP1HYX0_9EUKA